MDADPHDAPRPCRDRRRYLFTSGLCHFGARHDFATTASRQKNKTLLSRCFYFKRLRAHVPWMRHHTLPIHHRNCASVNMQLHARPLSSRRCRTFAACLRTMDADPDNHARHQRRSLQSGRMKISMASSRSIFRKMVFPVLLTGVLGALSSPGFSAESPPSRPTWPSSEVAQRDFVTHQIFVDRGARPGRVWLISPVTNSRAHAVEFFSGEKVDAVQVAADSKRLTFSDAHGHDYAGVKARTLTVSVDNPSSYAGWQEGSKGHEVILGARLDARATSTSGLPTNTSTTTADHLFDGQASCEAVPYVIRTQGSTYQESEKGFTERTKIFADFDKTRSCWTSQPLQSINLEDNTFLLVTKDRVFRIDTKNLTPSGSAPDLKIIDIKDH